MIELNCPNCVAKLKVNPEGESIICEACKTEFLIKERIKPRAELFDKKEVGGVVAENLNADPPGLDIVLEPIRKTELKMQEKFWNAITYAVGDGKPLLREQKIIIQIVIALILFVIVLLFKCIYSELNP